MTHSSQMIAKAPWRLSDTTVSEKAEKTCEQASVKATEVIWNRNGTLAEDCVTVVKNTFINVQCLPSDTPNRRKSVPASARLCHEAPPSKSIFDKFPSILADSDASTDAQTEASTCSECGVKTPVSLDNYCFDDASSTCHLCEHAPFDGAWLEPPSSSLMQRDLPAGSQRLSSKAVAFEPRSSVEDVNTQPYKDQVAEVILWAQEAMRESKDVASVEVIVDDAASGWSMIVRPQGKVDSDWQTESLMTLAKEALLDAASQSKRTFVMGYCAPKPFVMQPQGFQVSLGVMQNPKLACWHAFKKGFCRHGSDCCKEHPVFQTPLNVVVESAHFSSDTRFVGEFKQEIADLVMAVMGMLTECTYAERVEAVRNKDSQGWTIEVMPAEELATHKDYLLNLAKSALFSTTGASNTVYIMGYASKPFFSKSQGFMTILGDMQDEARACWDLYSKGFCSKDCACRWAHPECYMPLNVVIKEKSPSSSPQCLDSVLHYLTEDVPGKFAGM